MKLLTKEIERRLPPIYSQDGKGDEATVVVKFFTPFGSGTWYMTEANAVLEDGTEVPLTDPRAKDRVDVLFFGYCTGLGHNEYGYSSLREFEALGPRIERDRHFGEITLAEAKRRDAA